MNKDDFRYMLRGKQLSCLKQEDYLFLNPVNQRGEATDRALLVLHGFSSSPAVYRDLIPQIKYYDAIVCPVLPGHGESIEALSKSKSSEWLACATEYCEELVKTYKEVDVLGLSLGGLLACELAKQFKLHHLYLLAPALKLDLNIDRSLKLAKALQFLGFRHLRNVAGNLMTHDKAEIAYRKLPITAIIEMLNYAKDYQWIAPACPTDLFLGAFDRVVSSKNIEALFAPLPHVNIHWLNNSAHVLPLDNDMQAIVDCINQRNSEITLS